MAVVKNGPSRAHKHLAGQCVMSYGMSYSIFICLNLGVHIGKIFRTFVHRDRKWGRGDKKDLVTAGVWRLFILFKRRVLRLKELLQRMSCVRRSLSSFLKAKSEDPPMDLLEQNPPYLKGESEDPKESFGRNILWPEEFWRWYLNGESLVYTYKKSSQVLKYIYHYEKRKSIYIFIFYELLNNLSLHGFPNLFLLSFFTSFFTFKKW